MKLTIFFIVLTVALYCWAGSPAEPNPEMLPELHALATAEMATSSMGEMFFDIRQYLSNDTVRCRETAGDAITIYVNDAFEDEALKLEFAGNYFAFRDHDGRLLRMLSYRQYATDPLSIVEALQAAYDRATR